MAERDASQWSCSRSVKREHCITGCCSAGCTRREQFERRVIVFIINFTCINIWSSWTGYGNISFCVTKRQTRKSKKNGIHQQKGGISYLFSSCNDEVLRYKVGCASAYSKHCPMWCSYTKLTFHSSRMWPSCWIMRCSWAQLSWEEYSCNVFVPRKSTKRRGKAL